MEIRELSDDLKEQVKADLNEDPQRIQADLNIVKIWLAKQPHIIGLNDDQWLIAFIRGCKYRLERVKEKLDNFYTFKTAYSDIFCSLDPFDEINQSLLKSGAILPLLKPGPNNSRVVLMRTGILDSYLFSRVVPFLFMIYELLLIDDDYSTIGGIHFLSDCKMISLEHLKHFTPMLIKKVFLISQEGFPFRIKSTRYFNSISILETYFSIMKPFLSEKLKNRTFITSNDHSYYFNDIPQDIFPEEYGGNSGSIQNITDYWKQKMENRREWFLENVRYKTDESKRPAKTKLSDSLFGTEGTFRELKVD